MQSYRKLIVYQKARLLVSLVYQTSLKFPKHEIYGITSQLRRAAVSILLNIAEGYVRRSRRDFSRFIDISVGSCAEVDVLIELSLEFEYLNKLEYDKLMELKEEVAKLLFSFRRSLNSET